VFLFLTAAVFTFYGLASALIRRYLLQRPKVQRALELITGSFYLLIGFGLALATRSR
jgi:threonine/homoserine/homoserine lactone efflux protein